MKLSLVKEMRDIDRRSVEEYGIPEIVLMENAGRRTAEAALEILENVKGKSICVLAGSGNNGGDAFVAARHLANMGARVKVFLAGNVAHITKSAAINRDAVKHMEIELHTLEGDRAWDRLQVVLRFADLVIDGILGTGCKGELREDVLKLVRLVNAANKPVVAVDIATGVEADTGQVKSEAVQAACTVALGVPKLGHLLCPGAALTGRLLVDDIGIPAKLLEEGLNQNILDAAQVSSLLPPRAMDAHKGNCGRILVIAGSRGMTGAAALASEAALRSGAGVVTLAVPESLHDLMEMKLTEVMTQPVPEVKKGIIGGDKALAALLQMTDGYDAVLIGPGLGRDDETGELVRKLAGFVEIPVILDADGIFAYHGYADQLKSCKQVPILTPHLGEMASFLGVTVEELRGSLLETVREAAKEYQSVFVVKSECTVIVYPDGEAFFSPTGNPGMATAGSGDVLAGTIAGLIKQMESGVAPLAGVYLHGLAGDFAAQEMGEGLIASDILAKLPKARVEIDQNR